MDQLVVVRQGHLQDHLLSAGHGILLAMAIVWNSLCILLTVVNDTGFVRGRLAGIA
ncbi:MAG: hypothetical protein R3F37_15595 [Candidatus Competibacteraceae bacterium]